KCNTLLNSICSHTDYDTMKSENEEYRQNKQKLIAAGYSDLEMLLNDKLPQTPTKKRCQCKTKLEQQKKRILQKFITDLDLKLRKEKITTKEIITTIQKLLNKPGAETPTRSKRPPPLTIKSNQTRKVVMNTIEYYAGNNINNDGHCLNFDQEKEKTWQELNSAATSLKPKIVIQAISDYYEKYSINSHSEGNNSLSNEVRNTIGRTRHLIAEKINGGSEEIIFLPSTTYSLNILALSLQNYLEKGDKIALTHLEHNFTIDINHLDNYIDQKTKIVSFVHMRGGKKIGPKEKINNSLPLAQKFEVGTLPLAQIFGLKASLEFLNSFESKEVSNYEKELKDYALQELANLERIIIYNKNLETIDIVLFNLKGYHAHDVADYLGKNDICVRVGNFCCPYLKELIGVEAALRISLFIYNTKEDIDKLVSCLKKLSQNPHLIVNFVN
ncbi:20972_t:CDS:2, partial [Entrophospora sp. SA101]